jgi:hypothetical protein
MDNLQQIGISGLPGVIVALVTTIIGVIYAINSSRSKAEEISKNAYEKAIKAMQTYTEILEKRVADVEEENERLSRELKALRGAKG